MSVLRVNEFIAFPGKLDDLLEMFREIVPMIRLADGCESCDMLIPANGKEKLVILEQWRDIKAHQAAAKHISGSDFKRIISLLDGAKDNFS